MEGHNMGGHHMGGHHMGGQHIKTGGIGHAICKRFPKAPGCKEGFSMKQSIAGWVLLAIFLVIVFAIAGHYMRYWTLPKVSFIPQKPAPASHLQYFFF